MKRCYWSLKTDTYMPLRFLLLYWTANQILILAGISKLKESKFNTLTVTQYSFVYWPFFRERALACISLRGKQITDITWCWPNRSWPAQAHKGLTTEKKLKKGQRKQTAKELAEQQPQNRSENLTNPPRPTKRPNTDESTRWTTSLRPPTETTEIFRGCPSIHQKKQLHGDEASAGDDQ